MSNRDWVVYLVRCFDGSLYCGITNNIKNRLLAHNLGKGAKYTKSRRPVELVAAVYERTKSEALKLEYKIKHVSTDSKITELVKVKVKLKMNLKKELQKVTDEISAMATLVDKMMAVTGKIAEPAGSRTKSRKKAPEPLSGHQNPPVRIRLKRTGTSWPASPLKTGKVLKMPAVDLLRPCRR